MVIDCETAQIVSSRLDQRENISFRASLRIIGRTRTRPAISISRTRTVDEAGLHVIFETLVVQMPLWPTHHAQHSINIDTIPLESKLDCLDAVDRNHWFL
jgi:hypothetical protein